MAYRTVEHNYESAMVQDDTLATRAWVIQRQPEKQFFYEFEAAVVLDVVLDSTHPIFSKKSVDVENCPPNLDGTLPSISDKDYSWIGRIKFRFVNSQQGQPKDTLFWAKPLENTGVTEYPLMNETVIVVEYLDEYYYTRKLNLHGNINTNADFSLERQYGLVESNTNEYTKSKYIGPDSSMNFYGDINHSGILGAYFKFNHQIRPLTRFEGDTILESRFGSSIRFGAYDSNRKNDPGLGNYSDNGGNPQILIRNRQRTIGSKDVDLLVNKSPMSEDVNQDGSSIHITSGKTVSTFSTTCKKKVFQSGREEQTNFSPEGSTDFKFPTLDGDQIVINSDRVVISSKANESLFFSKKRMALTTDDEMTLDANGQVVITTNDIATINAPQIFLGAWGDTDEPALLGRTSVYWLSQQCDWMLNVVDTMITFATATQTFASATAGHSHTPVGPSSDYSAAASTYGALAGQTVSSLTQYRAQLVSLQDSLTKLMSNRVFLVGGGGSPGYDGGSI